MHVTYRLHLRASLMLPKYVSEIQIRESSHPKHLISEVLEARIRAAGLGKGSDLSLSPTPCALLCLWEQHRHLVGPIASRGGRLLHRNWRGSGVTRFICFWGTNERCRERSQICRYPRNFLLSNLNLISTKVYIYGKIEC